ncbi:hypothetical protein FOZ63_013705 [Perkinsus olseni]|uniref:Uncharacterized protein n=1 Tax=Perkinsus olseni TaxID=32597 RepID=A0A7J6R0R1_PEROL|nr:hypothetical protein FOZ63_013705 [Perkinsus olseni]
MGACTSCFETPTTAVPPPAAPPVQVVYSVQKENEESPDVTVYHDTLELPVSPTTVMASQPCTVTTVTTETVEYRGLVDQVVVEDSDGEDVPDIEEVSVESITSEGDHESSGDVEITSTAVEPSVLPDEVDATVSDDHDGRPGHDDEVAPLNNPVPVELLRTAAALKADQNEPEQPPPATAHALTAEGASFALAACSGISASSIGSPDGSGEGSPAVPAVAQTIMSMTSGLQPGESGPVYQPAASEEAPVAQGTLEPVDAGVLGQRPLGLAEVSAEFDIGLVQQLPPQTDIEEAEKVTTDEVAVQDDVTEETTVVVDEVVETSSSAALTERHFPYLYDTQPSPPTDRKFPYLYDHPQLGADRTDGEAAVSTTMRKFPYLYDHPVVEDNTTDAEASSAVTSRKFPYLYDHPVVEDNTTNAEASSAVPSRKFPYLYDRSQLRGAVAGSSEGSASAGTRKFPYLYDSPLGVAPLAQAPVASSSTGSANCGEATWNGDEKKVQRESMPAVTASKFPYMYDKHSMADAGVISGSSSSAAAPPSSGTGSDSREAVSAGHGESTAAIAGNGPIEGRAFPYLYDKHSEASREGLGQQPTEGSATAGSVEEHSTDRRFPYLYTAASSDEGSDSVATTATTATTTKTQAPRVTGVTSPEVRE